MTIQHFILTRFNLLLWNKDKEGHKVRSKEWLEHRFALFERYCLPSIKSQTCQEFEWIVLIDSTTPERFKERIAEYQRECKQLIPVYVEPERGRYFSEIFREQVAKRILAVQEFKGLRVQDYQELENSKILAPENSELSTDSKLSTLNSTLKVLTTYLDNDDALNVGFVEDIQKRAAGLSDETFINYTDGYQFFTDYNYMMRIHYPRNHFVSVVENGNPATVKTIYGYGSHYYIEKIEGARIENVENLPMWCEVIHEKNMGNDAYFLGAKMVREAAGFGFMVHGSLFTVQDSQDSQARMSDQRSSARFKYGAGLYLFRFLPRYIKTFFRRCKYFVFGRHW